jgi:hypothetical protein
MVVRRMRPEDASDAHTIHTQCLTRTLRGPYSDEQRAAWLSGRTPEGYMRSLLLVPQDYVPTLHFPDADVTGYRESLPEGSSMRWSG